MTDNGSTIFTMNTPKGLGIQLIRMFGEVFWEISGGGGEEGQTTIEIAQKRLLEETTINTQLRLVKPFYSATQKDGSVFDVYSEHRNYSVKLPKRSEIAEIRLFTLNEIIDMRRKQTETSVEKIRFASFKAIAMYFGGNDNFSPGENPEKLSSPVHIGGYNFYNKQYESALISLN